MRRFTTPTLNITIKRENGEVATDLIFDYLMFTIKSNGKRIDKTIPFSEVQEGKFKVRYTQEETGQMGGCSVKSEINFFTNNTRVGTIIKCINLDDNLVNEVI